MVSRGPITKAVSSDTVASAGSRRSPRLAQKSRGDGSYSQLRRISSPLTAKKMSTPRLPSEVPNWWSGSGRPRRAKLWETSTDQAASSRSRSKLLSRLLEPVGQADGLEPLLGQAPRRYLGRRGHGAQATNTPRRRIGDHGARR